jgi:hypothetical protein
MSTTETRSTVPATTPAPKPTNGTTGKKERKTPERRERSGVEAATSKVMNLIGRLTPADQRKVMAAVGALVSKDD